MSERSDWYLREAAKTESANQEEISKRFFATSRMAHHAIGISTEAGELLDAVKKNIFYGRPLDVTNIKEELGDLLWYVAGMINTLRELGEDVTFDSIFEQNVSKLRKRYGDNFTSERAINRDLKGEREILEKK